MEIIKSIGINENPPIHRKRYSHGQPAFERICYTENSKAGGHWK